MQTASVFLDFFKNTHIAFRPRLIIRIFLPILGSKYSCEYS